MGFLAFISGPWGALLQKGLMILALIGVVYVSISQYNHYITESQMLRDQNAQMIQLEKDNQDLDRKLTTVQQINGDILIKLDNKNQKVIETHDRVTTYIQSPDAQKSNRPTSDIIKNTIGMLRNEE